MRIAQDLMERARAEGVSLVGEGGLLQQVTRTVLQTALEAEMAEHLGYERGQIPPTGVDNQRNADLCQDGARRGRRVAAAGAAGSCGELRSADRAQACPTAGRV